MVTVKRIEALTIDLDDTLWPIMPVIERAERDLYQWLARNCPRVTHDYSPERVDQLRAEVLARHPKRSHDYAFLRRSVIESLLTACGYAVELADVAYRVFLRARNDVELFDDVVPTLEWLHQRYRLVALTNGNADIAVIGLDRYFATTVRAADVGAAKPDGRIFAAAADAAGVPPERILHVGDAPWEDVTGANRAGMRSAWLNRNRHRWPVQYPQPHSELSRLDELVAILSG